MRPSSPTGRLHVLISAGSAANEVVGVESGELRIRVSAPAKQGKANRELLAFLGRCLGLPGSRLTLIRGEASRHKVVGIDGLTGDAVLARLGVR